MHLLHRLISTMVLCLSFTFMSVQSHALGCIGDWPDQICAEPQPPVRKPVTEEAYLVARFASVSSGSFNRTIRQGHSLRSLVGAMQICYGGSGEDVIALLSGMSNTTAKNKPGYFSSFSAFVHNGQVSLTASTSVHPAFAVAYLILPCN